MGWSQLVSILTVQFDKRVIIDHKCAQPHRWTSKRIFFPITTTKCTVDSHSAPRPRPVVSSQIFPSHQAPSYLHVGHFSSHPSAPQRGQLVRSCYGDNCSRTIARDWHWPPTKLASNSKPTLFSASYQKISNPFKWKGSQYSYHWSNHQRKEPMPTNRHTRWHKEEFATPKLLFHRFASMYRVWNYIINLSSRITLYILILYHTNRHYILNPISHDEFHCSYYTSASRGVDLSSLDSLCVFYLSLEENELCLRRPRSSSLLVEEIYQALSSLQAVSVQTKKRNYHVLLIKLLFVSNAPMLAFWASKLLLPPWEV